MDRESYRELLSGFLLGQRLKNRTGTAEHPAQGDPPEPMSRNFQLGVAMGMASKGRPYRGFLGKGQDGWNGDEGDLDYLEADPFRAQLHINSPTVASLRNLKQAGELLSYSYGVGILSYVIGKSTRSNSYRPYYRPRVMPEFVAGPFTLKGGRYRAAFPPLTSYPYPPGQLFLSFSRPYYLLYKNVDGVFTIVQRDGWNGWNATGYEYPASQVSELATLKAYIYPAFESDLRFDLEPGEYLLEIYLPEPVVSGGYESEAQYSFYGQQAQLSFGNSGIITGRRIKQ